jgi:hypothetical protein
MAQLLCVFECAWVCKLLLHNQFVQASGVPASKPRALWSFGQDSKRRALNLMAGCIFANDHMLPVA